MGVPKGISNARIVTDYLFVPMANLQGIALVLLFFVLGAPFILFPRKIARSRYRYATDPEPTKEGIQEMQLAGVILVVTGIFILTLVV